MEIRQVPMVFQITDVVITKNNLIIFVNQNDLMPTFNTTFGKKITFYNAHTQIQKVICTQKKELYI